LRISARDRTDPTDIAAQRHFCAEIRGFGA
jgi:hypothetical protein